MDQILENLKNPAWWFTAFFVAIIAGLIAGFLKDWIIQIISRFSDSVRDWKIRNAKETEAVLSAAESDINILILLLLRTIYAMLLYITSLVTFTLAPIFFILKHSTNQEIEFIDQLMLKVFFPIMGVLLIIVTYTLVTRLKISSMAWKRFVKNRDLAKLDE